jgi:Thymidylate synthase complementing protein
LVDFDPDAEVKLLTAICYPHSHLPEHQIAQRVRTMTPDERSALIRAYVGERENRRHKPGRAFERVDYRFDVLSDYGAFRDMQRHRMLTIDWQALTPNHGYVRPEVVDDAGMADVFDDAMARSAALFDALKDEFPQQASYAVSMAYRLRYSMQFNAREAIHMLELRSSPQGHPAYRRVALEMHRLIGEQAGHTAIADAMTHITQAAPELERLEAERRAEMRRGS